jgi:Xaa-Pro aminopeptidase
MKTDLDSLMQDHNLDAILITGPGQHNPAMYYLTGGAHLTNADLIKKRGQAPVLFCYPMERDEAANTGLTVRNLADYRLQDLLTQNKGDQLKAAVARYGLMLKDLEITSGRVGLYGRLDAGVAFSVFSGLQKELPGLEVVGELGNSLINQAMATKDAAEAARIRQMGQVTTAVVGEVAEFLSSHRAKQGKLVKKDGTDLTIGEVKTRINLWLAERGAENPAGTIFSIGRDAGVPHSSGHPADKLYLGQTIVFDIFPCEAGGGYFYDFTRTWCLGFAPDEAQSLYDDVRFVYHQVMAGLKTGAWFRDYQELTCSLFEGRNHPTIKSDPQTQQGYVHSIGHGLGLNVHELPVSGAMATPADRLNPGVVVTIEPGLYYPERGLGVRLEDTVWVNPSGQFEILAPYPLDLVLPVKSS